MAGCLLFGGLQGTATAKKGEGRRAAATSAKKQAVKKAVAKRSSAETRAARAKGRISTAKAAAARSRLATRAGLPRRAAVVLPAPRLSYGQVYGLHETLDPLELKSSVALVLDQETDEVLLSKNSQAVLPIASITKLMTALVVIEAGQPLDELLTITDADVDTEKGSSSRLMLGAELTRGEMLHLALMSSENRAANALGRHYPGGLPAFVAAMNRKAAELGMHDTRYVEPTGLSSRNQSSARDLATLVKAAHEFPLIRELSTSPAHEIAIGSRHLQFRNTNGLVSNPAWQIGLQKTGYIAEAGRCLVMQAYMGGRKVIMVFLDSSGRHSRLGDAERVRKWLLEEFVAPVIAPVTPPTELTPRVTS
ncbi:D-alanyl-D-alanine endopeptidase [Aquabacterium sp. A7-Y]|uniref:D-alanyl-D-alanine endopeptidase n=1 Tax=Aquabacterium sp. A7-Y TaxID=1349605 RepID=UPI0039FD53F5